MTDRYIVVSPAPECWCVWDTITGKYVGNASDDHEKVIARCRGANAVWRKPA